MGQVLVLQLVQAREQERHVRDNASPLEAGLHIRVSEEPGGGFEAVGFRQIAQD